MCMRSTLYAFSRCSQRVVSTVVDHLCSLTEARIFAGRICCLLCEQLSFSAWISSRELSHYVQCSLNADRLADRASSTTQGRNKVLALNLREEIVGSF